MGSLGIVEWLDLGRFLVQEAHAHARFGSVHSLASAPIV